MANVIVLGGSSEKSDGDLPRILWDNDLVGTPVVASSTAADSNTAYLTDGRLDRAWESASGTTHTLTWTFAASTAISAVGIHGHNIGDLPDGSVLVEVWLSGGSGWTTAIGTTAITGTRTFYRGFSEITVDQLRITITHTGATQPAIAAVSAGLDFECMRGLQTGWADPLLGRSPTTRPAVSRNGIPLPGTIVDATLRQSFNLANVSFAWASETWLPFHRACDGAALPFFLSWAPLTYPDRACYCSGAEFMSTDMSQKGYCDVGFSARMDIETGWRQI